MEIVIGLTREGGMHKGKLHSEFGTKRAQTTGMLIDALVLPVVLPVLDLCASFVLAAHMHNIICALCVL